MYQSEPELMEASRSPPPTPHELSPAAFINAVQYANVLEGRFKQLQGKRCEGGGGWVETPRGEQVDSEIYSPLSHLPGQSELLGTGALIRKVLPGISYTHAGFVRGHKTAAWLRFFGTMPRCPLPRTGGGMGNMGFQSGKWEPRR